MVEQFSLTLQTYSKYLCNYIVHPVDQNLFVFILQYNPKVTDHQITNMEIKLEQAFFDNIVIPGQAWLEFGPTTTVFQNISVSYSETLLRLTEKKYHNKKAPSVIEKADDDKIIQDYHYFQVQLKTVAEYVMNGNPEPALQKSLQLCNSVYTGNPPQDLARIYEYYRQAFLSMLSSFHLQDTAAKEYAFIFDEAPYVVDGTYTADMIKDYIVHFCTAAIKLLSEKYQKQQHKYLLNAKRYIEEHYSDPDLSLHLLAEQCNTTTSYLSRLFKDSFGINFVDYLNAQRIECAKGLLDMTPKTVSEIASATGFNSQQNFIRVFKKHVGLTPGQYRSRK